MAAVRLSPRPSGTAKAARWPWCRRSWPRRPDGTGGGGDPLAGRRVAAAGRAVVDFGIGALFELRCHVRDCRHGGDRARPAQSRHRGPVSAAGDPSRPGLGRRRTRPCHHRSRSGRPPEPGWTIFCVPQRSSSHSGAYRPSACLRPGVSAQCGDALFPPRGARGCRSRGRGSAAANRRCRTRGSGCPSRCDTAGRPARDGRVSPGSRRRSPALRRSRTGCGCRRRHRSGAGPGPRTAGSWARR